MKLITIFTFSITLLILGLVSSNALADEAGTTKPSDLEIRIYDDLYNASVLLGEGFDDAIDPEEAIREAIFLEDKVASVAREEGIEEDESLMADVDYYQTQFLLDAMMQTMIKLDDVDSEKIEARYAELKAAFKPKERVEFQHLFLLVPKDDSEAEAKQQEIGEQVVGRLDRGMEFSRLVEEYSDIENAGANEGKVGPVDITRLNEALRKAIEDMSEGESAGPIRTPYGWEVVKLLNREVEEFPTLEEKALGIEVELQTADINKQREKIEETAREHYPADLKVDDLAGGDYSLDDVLLEINGRVFTGNELIWKIYATHSLGQVEDPKERIAQGIDRIILTEQFRELARERGLLDQDAIQKAMDLIADRLVAERYFKTHRVDVEPTDEELSAYYEENAERFRERSRVNGRMLVWPIENSEGLSRGELEYQRTLKKKVIEDLIKSYGEGAITREEFESKAPEVRDLGWFAEGPMGFQTDMAFFSTDPGNFTEPFPVSEGIAVGWVEELERGMPPPLDEIRDRVRDSYILDKSREARNQMVESILQEYAALP